MSKTAEKDDESNEDVYKRGESNKFKGLNGESKLVIYYNKVSSEFLPYRPDQKQTIYDVIKYFSGLKAFEGSTLKKCEESLNKLTVGILSTVIRKVTMKSMVFVGKIDDEHPYEVGLKISSKGFLFGSYDGGVTLRVVSYDSKTGEKKYVDKVVGPFYSLLSNNMLISSSIVCEPYHMDLPPEPNPKKLNVFRGFKAVYQPQLSIEDCKRICKPLLDHVFKYLACDDEEVFIRIMESVYFPIRELKKSEIMTILIGPQGVGKTALFYFIQLYVLGKNIMEQITGLDSITGDFNSILESKLIVCVNEAVQATAVKFLGVKQSEILKELITGEQLMIQAKYVDRYPVKNNVSLFLTTNNDQPLLVSKDDRRFFIVKTSDKVENDTYFDKLFDSFNQEMGNAFYTLARKQPPLCKIKKILMTEAKREAIKASMPKAFNFFSSVFEDSEAIIPRDYLHVSNNEIYLSVKDAYLLYSRWQKETRNGELWSENRFARALKAYEGLKHVERKRLNTRPQMAYVIITEKLYKTTVYMDLESNRDHPISDLVKKGETSESEEDDEIKEARAKLALALEKKKKKQI